MAIQQGITTSFKQEMLQAVQNLVSDQLYMALYDGFATLGPNTTAYIAENEVSSDGTGYTAGGLPLTGVSLNTDYNTGLVYVSFDNVVWDPVTFTARGALIYNATQGNRSVAVIDFGSDKVATSTFTVTMPANAPTTALLRFT
jgi:hypothetical protein